ncbi:MAG: TlyA family RNA methyltransferase [Anaerolineaceae bacterium]|nr:TlyA family RNA methyltransferase [Anaerolineaceae bacterium]
MAGHERLDVLLAQRGLVDSRSRARAMIMAGEVLVNGQRVDKAGTRVTANATLELKAKPRYVSRGGDKLAAALEAFRPGIAGSVCADVGASTGGFTDCLLQHGAARVYAIDVGYGQLDWTLRQDCRVVVMERSNARHVTHLPEPVDIVVIDVSFISLRLILPVIRNWMKTPANVVALVKPQFEAGRQTVGKGGVVRDPQVHRQVLLQVLTSAREEGFCIAGLLRSPLLGPAGNVEFLCWLKSSPVREDPNMQDPDKLVDAVL